MANDRTPQFGSPVAGKAAVKRAAKGRVCSVDGCTTVLSIYNDALECSMHERRTTKSGRSPLQ